MSAAVESLIVTEPGVYDGIPDETYHADPVPEGSLSVSGAKRLLPPSCPAIFAWERKHGRPDTRAFDFGHAAHAKVLGVGMPIAVIPDEVLAANGATSTKAAKEFIESARAAGSVPLKASEAAEIDAMAEKLLAHPIARVLFNPEFGQPEQSLFWTDPETGIWCRSRLDWMPYPSNGRMIIGDYKTAASANPDEFERAAVNFGYHMQAPFYIDAVTELGLADEADFIFVVQEKTPPYLVSVVQLDIVAMRIGQSLNRRARAIYAQCAAADHWPGYTDDVALVSVPGWYARAHEEDL